MHCSSWGREKSHHSCTDFSAFIYGHACITAKNAYAENSMPNFEGESCLLIWSLARLTHSVISFIMARNKVCVLPAFGKVEKPNVKRTFELRIVKFCGDLMV